MKGTFNLMIFMDMGFMNGQMVKDTTVIGTEIRCMEKVKSFGKTEENTKVIMSMIRNMVMVFLNGMMEEDMKVAGKMVNNTEKEYI